jgi:iron(III) transport system permease protein
MAVSAANREAMRPVARFWPWSGWSVHLLFAALVMAVPLALVVWSLFSTPGDGWEQTPASTIRGYAVNTFILLAGVGVVTTVAGVATAWFTAACEFAGRRMWCWLLVLPLALPAYVVAFGYGDLLDAMIPVVVWLRETWGPEAARAGHDGLRYVAVIGVLSSVLYPYVYLAARTAFLTQSRTALEAARMLGCGPAGAFFRVTLPLAWPAIAGGAILVAMEVMNDYGAVSHFGIPTLTIGIFRFWFSFGDPDSAARIAAVALLVVFALIGLEQLARGRRRFNEAGGMAAPLARYRLGGWRAVAATLVCAVPVTLGFALPVGRLIYWSVQVGASAWEAEFFKQIAHTLLLAGGATLLVIGLALTLAYTERLHAQRAVRWAGRLAVLGYAIPSAVLALGILRGLGVADGGLAAVLGERGHAVATWLLSGSVAALVFAYVARFLAVAFLPAQAGLKRVCGDLDASSRCLGASPLRTLFGVNLPLLRPTLLAAAMLVFVDVMKELPLTLLLRPFNLETLATRAFNLVDQGRLPEAAPACLLIVATGLAGVFVLNRLLEKETS